MSVFKKFQGKRIQPDDPNWEKGTWYMWARAGKGTVLHKALRAVATEEEAREIERTMIRTVISKAEGKHAVRFARRLSGLPDVEVKPEFIYILESGGYYKIGRTNDITKRLRAIAKTIIPFATSIVLVAAMQTSEHVEKILHEEFARYRVRGEWFLFQPWELRDLKHRIIELQAKRISENATAVSVAA